MTWVWLIGGLVVLVAGGELLVQNASAFALKARVSPLIVGLTIVAMGGYATEEAARVALEEARAKGHQKAWLKRL